ncbi:MAG: biotin transporter BioY [Oscillospiraceae bacterium]|jgi:biotin transport system substrate-specific component|nr:biotin transporter BioY [Oscillospiraceae bacterium]
MPLPVFSAGRANQVAPRRLSAVRLARAAVCAAMLAASAMLRFQFGALPAMTTAQVYMVLLIGLTLGAKDGAVSVALYLLIGLIGIPVFSKGGGMQTLFQPEGGYLLGFVAAAAVAGALRQSAAGVGTGYRAHPIWDGIAAFAGLAALYAVALPYIAVSQWALGSPVAAGKLVAAYGMAFWPLDAVKAILAALTARELLRAHPALFSRKTAI